MSEEVPDLLAALQESINKALDKQAGQGRQFDPMVMSPNMKTQAIKNGLMTPEGEIIWDKVAEGLE